MIHALILDVADWRDEAACRSDDPARTDAVFFAVESDDAALRAAKRVCRGCPVRPRCLQEALATAEPHGVFGGMTATERRRLRPKRGVPGIPRCGTESGARRHRQAGERTCLACADAQRIASRKRQQRAEARR